MIRFDDWKDFCYVIGQGFFVYAILGALLPVNKYFVLGYAGIQVLAGCMIGYLASKLISYVVQKIF